MATKKVARSETDGSTLPPASEPRIKAVPPHADLQEQLTELSDQIQRAADLVVESHMAGDRSMALEAFQEAVVAMRSIRIQLESLAESVGAEGGAA
jgi:hypothetical protein